LNNDAVSGRRAQRSAAGFTLVEVTIILLVLVILSTIMLPQLGNFNRLARFVVVKEDVGALCASLKKFIDEVMVPPYGAPGGTIAAPVAPIGLLVGPGGLPALSGGLVSAPPLVAVGNWDMECPNEATSFRVTPDVLMGGGPAVQTGFLCDRLEHNLQVNNPMGDGVYNPGDDPQHRYKNVIDSPSVGPFFGWRGPYFDEITSDPWGTRYAVNVFGLHSDTNGNVFSTAVICISFGPNKTADTPINMPGPTGYQIGGDDIVAVLSAMGPF
jgi:hypothetical protein